MAMDSDTLLNLLQLASPALPVGAYSYSEGLETLIAQQIIGDRFQLYNWIVRELRYGSIRVETAVMVRGYRSFHQQDLEQLQFWNAWLSAQRETRELRQQSWQMGRSLLQLLANLYPLQFGQTQRNSEQTSPPGRDERNLSPADLELQENRAVVPDLSPCNYAIAFSIAAVLGNIPPETAALAYLHSWTTNLVGAGVKLIPLGQTAGQQLLVRLRDRLAIGCEEILAIADEALDSCSWGLTLASMAHETQYTRLFRS